MVPPQWLRWQDRDQVRPRTWWVPESLCGGVKGLDVREEQGTQLRVTAAGWESQKGQSHTWQVFVWEVWRAIP